MEKSIWENISSQGRDVYAMHTTAFSHRRAAIPLLLFVFQVHWLEFQSYLAVLFNTFLKDKDLYVVLLLHLQSPSYI